MLLQATHSKENTSGREFFKVSKPRKTGMEYASFEPRPSPFLRLHQTKGSAIVIIEHDALMVTDFYSKRHRQWSAGKAQTVYFQSNWYDLPAIATVIVDQNLSGIIQIIIPLVLHVFDHGSSAGPTA